VTAVEAFDDVRARHNAVILAIAQALYGINTTIVFVTGGLVGLDLAPSRDWATLPVSAFIVGTALTTFPASLLMKRIGRRAGFMLGATFGLAGAGLAVYAIYERAFILFTLAVALHGIYQATAQYYRFAAADLASPAFRPKAISWVLTGGVASSVAGTLLVMATTDLLAPVVFAGCYAAMAVMALASIAVLVTLDFPAADPGDAGKETGRPLLQVARQPRYIVAVLVGMLTYGIMNLVMTAAPVAMVGCGFAVQDSSWAIQWHSLAMFVPSFFTGHLIQRFGVERVSAAGMALLTCAAVSGLLGLRFENFAIGLVLLGLGWNFGFIGGTTLLTGTYEPSERNKAQGLNDFMVFATTAVASLGAGKLLAAYGWEAVNYAVFPMVLVAIAAIAWLVKHRRDMKAP